MMNQGKVRGIWHELKIREMRTGRLWDIRRERVLDVDERIILNSILIRMERRTSTSGSKFEEEVGSCEHAYKNSGFINAQHFFIMWDIISFSRRTLPHRITPNGASRRVCCAGYKASRILQLCSSSYRLRSRIQTNIFLPKL